jgi:hypothetical protein
MSEFHFDEPKHGHRLPHGPFKGLSNGVGRMCPVSLTGSVLRGGPIGRGMPAACSRFDTFVPAGRARRGDGCRDKHAVIPPSRPRFPLPPRRDTMSHSAGTTSWRQFSGILGIVSRRTAPRTAAGHRVPPPARHPCPSSGGKSASCRDVNAGRPVSGLLRPGCRTRAREATAFRPGRHAAQETWPGTQDNGRPFRSQGARRRVASTRAVRSRRGQVFQNPSRVGLPGFRA